MVGAVGARAVTAPVAVAAYSLGAFTAPLVWQRVPARTAAARRDGYPAEFDLGTYFLHDVPAGLMPGLSEHNVPQSAGPFGDVCAFDGWPGVPLHVIAGLDDRFFPLELQRRVARERLGLEPEVVPGGHLALLSRPAELSAALDRRLRAVSGSGAGRPR